MPGSATKAVIKNNMSGEPVAAFYAGGKEKNQRTAWARLAGGVEELET
jgi:hypothetical protein